MPSQRCRSWRWRPAGIPLRVALIAPFFLLVLGAAGVTAYFTHRTAHRAIDELAGKLFEEIGLRIEENLRTQLSVPRQLLATNLAALRVGILDPRNLPALEAYFFQQTTAFPTISTAMLTNERKDFVAAGRWESDRIIRVCDGARRDGLYNYQADASGNRQRLLWLETGFDPHDDPPGNPWYAAVRNVGQPHWRLVVGEIEAGQTFLILGRMAPFEDAGGQFQGVTGVSLFLSQIGKFLQGLRMGRAGQALIVDADGLLIAASTGESPFDRRPGAGLDPGKLRLAAVESQNPLTQGISRYLVDAAGGFARFTGVERFKVELDKQIHFLQVRPFADENLDWRIIVAVPETDILGLLRANVIQMIALIGVALIVTLWLAVSVAYWITRPVLQLNAGTLRLARGDSPEPFDAGRIIELRELADAFQRMAAGRGQSFGEWQALNRALVDHQEHLEAEIARRTGDLRFYQQIVDSSPDAMSLVGADYCYKMINQTYLHLSGLSQEQIIGHSVAKIVGRAAFDKVVKPSLDRCLTGSMVNYGEWFELPVRGRRYMEVTYCPCRDSNASIIGVVAISRDSTEKKQAEIALRELNQQLDRRVEERTEEVTRTVEWLEQETRVRRDSEERLEQALNAADAGAWEWRAATNQALWSDGNYRVLGLTPRSVEARYENWLRCVHPDDRAEAERQVAQAIELKNDLNVEFRVVWPDGGIHWLADIGRLVCDSAGNPVGMYGIQIDITERKKVEDALREALARLEQETRTRRDQEMQLAQARKLEAIGQLTGGIAHDFNNLLTVIKGNLDLLRQQAANRLTYEDDLWIKDALSATRDGTELTAGLLAFSRRQPLRPQPVQINDLVRSLERLLGRVLGPAIAWRIEIDPALPPLLTDAGQLQATLLNLVLNAQDAMPGGGTVGIQTAVVTLPGAGVSPAVDLALGAYGVITVTDSGAGMDADTLARACEPFFTTKAGHGTGLGLSIAHGFAAQSGGGLVLDSWPGRGTTARLFLPVAPASGAPAMDDAPSAPLPAPVGGSETILVVEDQARVRRLACRYLREFGYHVLEAADAEEALAILETEADLKGVFSDIIMPGERNGYDLAAWIAAHRPEVKCLLATGYTDRARAVPTGDSPQPPVLLKPYSGEQLARRLRQALDEG